MTSKLTLPPTSTNQGRKLSQAGNTISSSEVVNKTNTVSMEKLCNVCNAPNSQYRCSRCKIYYCAAECQKKDWAGHKSVCQEAFNSVVKKKNSPPPSNVPEAFQGKVDVIKTTVSSLPFQYFSIKENGRSYGFHFWSDYVSTIGQDIAQEVIRSLPKSSKKVNVDSNLFLAKLPTAMGKVASELQKRNIPNYSIHLRNIESILETGFSKGTFEIDNSSPEAFTESWVIIMGSIDLWGSYDSTKIDPKYCSLPMTFSSYAEERFQKLLGNPTPLRDLPNTDLSCFSYAFCKTERIEDLLYWKMIDKAAWIKELYNMGYENVLTAEDGDFVFCFASKDKPPTHLGIWREPGLIESKLGNINPHVFALEPLDSPECHGGNFAFFRKSSHKTT